MNASQALSHSRVIAGWRCPQWSTSWSNAACAASALTAVKIEALQLGVVARGDRPTVSR